MPYAKRDDTGRLVALLADPEPGANELIGASHPEVVQFLGKGVNPLVESDANMARVTEDLIDVLVARGVVMFTDLPPIAQRKLLERRKIREQRDTVAAAAQGTAFAVDGDELI